MTTKTLLMQKVEREQGATLEEIIAEMTQQGQSREAIARRFGVSYWTLTDWLKELGATFETTVRFERELAGSGLES